MLQPNIERKPSGCFGIMMYALTVPVSFVIAYGLTKQAGDAYITPEGTPEIDFFQFAGVMFVCMVFLAFVVFKIQQKING